MEYRPVWAEVNLWALRANVAALVAHVSPASVLAVVKADAYGHGANAVAHAALEAGATRLGVALVEEGQRLRDAGISAPILLMSEPVPTAAPATVALGLTPLVYTFAGIEALAKAVVELDAPRPYAVHLNIDTGMHRVGCAPGDAVAMAEAIAAFEELELAGICTHFATADRPRDPYIEYQRARFFEALQTLRATGHSEGVIHLANSAAAITLPEVRADFVRTGISMFGVHPVSDAAPDIALHPVLSLHARVTYVHEIPAGASVSYGRYYAAAETTRIATVPIGYADGVPRGLGLRGGSVLIGGVRRPIAGAVTMDQLMVDCGNDRVEVGDDVVLIGQQGSEEISVQEWADRMDTIPYEILCGISGRVPRRVRG
ncbi:MAG: alanine racemase [Acidimicrobiia bacterium]